MIYSTGWASCDCREAEAVYGLSCGSLEVGDVCVPPTHSQPPLHLRDSDQSQVHSLELSSVVALSEMAQVGYQSLCVCVCGGGVGIYIHDIY